MKNTLRLLLLEDSENDELLIRFQLERSSTGFHMTRVESEGDLLAALERERWDLVIGDYNLPGFNGLTALAIIRRHDPDLPFIMISGVKGEAFAVEAMRAGAGDYITKDSLSRLAPAIDRELAASEERRARRRSDEALQSRNRRLRLLSDLAGELLAAASPVDAASAAYRRIAGELDLHAYFNFFMEKDGTLRLDSFDGIPEQAARLIERLRPGEAVCGIVAATGEAVHITDIANSNDPKVRLLRHFGIRAYFCSPLTAGGKLLGTLSFGTRSRDRLSDEELDFIRTVVRYVALADERLRAEEGLRQSEEQFRAFFENAAVGSTLLDLKGRLVRMNERFCRMVGGNAEALLGHSIHHLTHPDHRHQEEEGFERLLRGELPFFEIEKIYLRKDGTLLWVQETTGVICDASGAPVRLAGIVQDISERKAAEAGRENLLAELESTIHSMGNGVITYGPKGEIRRMNPTAERMLNYPSETRDLSFMDRKSSLAPETPDGQPYPLERHPALRALEGETVLSEVMVYHPEGSERPFWTAVSAAPMRAADGTILGAVSTMTDITPLHDLQQEHEIYVHTISHDLRTPLSVVLGHAELLEMTCEDENAHVHVDAILKGAERMEAMIENLVEAARLEGGDIGLVKEPVQIADFLPALLQQTSAALETSRIAVEIPSDLPPVSADPDRLERILINLLTNALKYSPSDSVVTIVPFAKGDQVHVAVRDRGQGIDPRDLPHIFERFHRPKSGRKTGGVGLGLYITRSLVEAHGGRIGVESVPGEGSTFTFSLPVHEGRMS
jgi:PAS domain S-box-containing protein